MQSDLPAVRSALSRHMNGTGIELGPGSLPFPLPHPGTTVRYLDRWLEDENGALFSEVEDELFTRPDVVCDLGSDLLGTVRDASQDFVIASHVLEHVANPLALLDDIHRVVRPGGVALVLLPDMRRTFDRLRPATPLAHLVAEYEAGVTEVDDEHLEEFLRHTDPTYPPVADDPAERQRLFDLHRRRSIHVHCWDENTFHEVIDHAIVALGHRWEFVDGITIDDEGPEGLEFGYVLRRSTVHQTAEVTVARLRSTHDDWMMRRRRLHATREALMDAHRELAAMGPLRRPVLVARRRLGTLRQHAARGLRVGRGLDHAARRS